VSASTSRCYVRARPSRLFAGSAPTNGCTMRARFTRCPCRAVRAAPPSGGSRSLGGLPVGVGLGGVLGLEDVLSGALPASPERVLSPRYGLVPGSPATLPPSSQLALRWTWHAALRRLPPVSMPAQILVVDDEPSIVDAVATTLRYEGFEVVEATTGRAALAAVAASAPDLMVLDVMLPDLDGREVVRRLRLDGLRVPVLFLTARDAVEDRIAGLTLGRGRLHGEAVLPGRGGGPGAGDPAAHQSR
jgi:CheY-like chemotaxis protein